MALLDLRCWLAKEGKSKDDSSNVISQQKEIWRLVLDRLADLLIIWGTENAIYSNRVALRAISTNRLAADFISCHLEQLGITMRIEHGQVSQPCTSANVAHNLFIPNNRNGSRKRTASSSGVKECVSLPAIQTSSAGYGATSHI